MTRNKTTVRAALAWGTDALRRHACAAANAQREARDLLAAALCCDAAGLFMKGDSELKDEDRRRYEDLVLRRGQQEPLAHILGTAPFLGREFRVTRDTLIPRPATEHVVEAALAAAKEIGARNIVDVGTGSGIIAVSLALAATGAKVWATDISDAALAVARENAVLVQAPPIEFLKGDLLTPLPPETFDEPTVVVANLPYIPDGQWENLSPEIKDFEPRSAITSGADGLDDYRRLVADLAKRRPPPPFAVAMECLTEQCGPLEKIFSASFPNAKTTPIKNLGGTAVGTVVMIGP